MGYYDNRKLVPIEQVKARALRLMQNVGFGENFITALRDRDIVGMSAQRVRDPNRKPSPGKPHKQAFATIRGTRYGMYPYLRGLRFCVDELEKVQAKFEHLYFFHMLFLSLGYTEKLYFFSLPRCDYRYFEGDEDENVEQCWDEIEEDVDKQEDGLFWMDIYGFHFSYMDGAEFGFSSFKFADNGCIYCCGELDLGE
jgi:hypothetical protein